MIYGNKVGGGSSEKVYIITNKDETIKLDAVVIDSDDLIEFDAKCRDVVAGKNFVGEGGAEIGTNDIPWCRYVSGTHEIYPGVDVVLTLEENDMWNYSYLQGYISTNKNYYDVLMLIMDDAVYIDGEKVADVTKDAANKTIKFNITNNSSEVYLLHYFIFKEE